MPRSTLYKIANALDTFFGQGLGFHRSPDNGRRWYGHGGGTPGMSADLPVYRESGYVTIILTNLDPPSADILQGDFTKIVVMC